MIKQKLLTKKTKCENCGDESPKGAEFTTIGANKVTKKINICRNCALVYAEDMRHYNKNVLNRPKTKYTTTSDFPV